MTVRFNEFQLNNLDCSHNKFLLDGVAIRVFGGSSEMLLKFIKLFTFSDGAEMLSILLCLLGNKKFFKGTRIFFLTYI